MKFVEAKDIATNVRAFVFGLMYSADAYIFGKEMLQLDTIAHLARLYGLVLGALSAL
jgi:hypothetical protein